MTSRPVPDLQSARLPVPRRLPAAATVLQPERQGEFGAVLQWRWLDVYESGLDKWPGQPARTAPRCREHAQHLPPTGQWDALPPSGVGLARRGRRGPAGLSVRWLVEPGAPEGVRSPGDATPRGEGQRVGANSLPIVSFLRSYQIALTRVGVLASRFSKD